VLLPSLSFLFCPGKMAAERAADDRCHAESNFLRRGSGRPVEGIVDLLSDLADGYPAVMPWAGRLHLPCKSWFKQEWFLRDVAAQIVEREGAQATQHLRGAGRAIALSALPGALLGSPCRFAPGSRT